MKLTSLLNEIKVLKPNPYEYKTIGWWLYQLPEPIRTQALTNFKNEKISFEKRKDDEFNSAYRALDHAFNWDNTLEGEDYWWEIFKKLQRNQPLTEIKVVRPVYLNFDEASIFIVRSKVEYDLFRADYCLNFIDLGSYYTLPPYHGQEIIWLFEKKNFEVRHKYNENEYEFSILSHLDLLKELYKENKYKIVKPDDKL